MDQILATASIVRLANHITVSSNRCTLNRAQGYIKHYAQGCADLARALYWMAVQPVDCLLYVSIQRSKQQSNKGALLWIDWRACTGYCGWWLAQQIDAAGDEGAGDPHRAHLEPQRTPLAVPPQLPGACLFCDGKNGLPRQPIWIYRSKCQNVPSVNAGRCISVPCYPCQRRQGASADKLRVKAAKTSPLCWTCQIQARAIQPWARCSVFTPSPASWGNSVVHSFSFSLELCCCDARIFRTFK